MILSLFCTCLEAVYVLYDSVWNFHRNWLIFWKLYAKEYKNGVLYKSRVPIPVLSWPARICGKLEYFGLKSIAKYPRNISAVCVQVLTSGHLRSSRVVSDAWLLTGGQDNEVTATDGIEVRRLRWWDGQTHSIQSSHSHQRRRCVADRLLQLRFTRRSTLVSSSHQTDILHARTRRLLLADSTHKRRILFALAVYRLKRAVFCVYF